MVDFEKNEDMQQSDILKEKGKKKTKKKNASDPCHVPEQNDLPKASRTVINAQHHTGGNLARIT
jgi:hypothetical protein